MVNGEEVGGDNPAGTVDISQIDWSRFDPSALAQSILGQIVPQAGQQRGDGMNSLVTDMLNRVLDNPASFQTVLDTQPELENAISSGIQSERVAAENADRNGRTVDDIDSYIASERSGDPTALRMPDRPDGVREMIRERSGGRIDPLAIDLDKKGVQLVEVPKGSLAFDIDPRTQGSESMAEWLKPGSGFLVMDMDNDGEYAEDIYDMLGNFGENRYYATGFDRLRMIGDDNGDGVFNARDQLFLDMRVWHDANGNGKVDGEGNSSELRSLSRYGVAAIDLKNIRKQQVSAEQMHGGQHPEMSKAAMADGSMVDVADVWLLVDGMNDTGLDGEPATAVIDAPNGAPLRGTAQAYQPETLAAAPM